MQLYELIQETAFGHYLITFFISMLPVLELRGGIPAGVSMGLEPWKAMLVSIAGNMVPVPFIILFIRKIFKWLRHKSMRLERLVSRLESRAAGKWEKVHRFELIGLFILVAIPLPGTGAWTGALIAALMDLQIRRAFPAITAGVVVAGILITGLTYGFKAAL